MKMSINGRRRGEITDEARTAAFLPYAEEAMHLINKISYVKNIRFSVGHTISFFTEFKVISRSMSFSKKIFRLCV